MKRNFLSFAFALVAAVTFGAGFALAQSTASAGAKAYVPNTTKAQLAFYVANPAAQGGLAGVNFGTFQFFLGGADFTPQVLASLGGRGSQMYVNPAGTSMTAYVAGAFTGIPFVNAPAMVRVCLLTGQCVSSDRRTRNATGFPSNPGAINQLSPFLPAFSSTSTNPNYGISFVPYYANHHSVLTRLAGVINTDFGSMTQNGPEWNSFVIRLNIWSGSSFNAAKAAFDQSPLTGNYVADMPVTQAHQPYAGHWYVEYSLQNQVPLMAGTHYVIAIEHVNTTFTTRMNFKESNLVQQTDYYKADTFPTSQPLTSFNLNPGAAALDFYSYP